jgi:hypothetical protein
VPQHSEVWMNVSPCSTPRAVSKREQGRHLGTRAEKPHRPHTAGTGRQTGTRVGMTSARGKLVKGGEDSKG